MYPDSFNELYRFLYVENVVILFCTQIGSNTEHKYWQPWYGQGNALNSAVLQNNSIPTSIEFRHKTRKGVKCAVQVETKFIPDLSLVNVSEKNHRCIYLVD